MNGMWKNFGLPFKGYEVQDFEKQIAAGVRDPEKLTRFFDAFVRGKEDLYPVLEDCFSALGIEIKKTLSENTLLHRVGIQLNGQQVVQQIHPESKAYQHLMVHDQLLNLNSETTLWEVEVLRQGRKLKLSFEQESGNYFPLLNLEIGVVTELRTTWMH
jgi:predicted metalloprotease with PDZ domain